MYDSTKPYKTKILKLIKKTWKSPYLKVKESIYPITTPTKIYEQIDHTDGVGTKGIYHWRKHTYKNAALDALAMNLNDLAMVRATPFKLQNHIILPEDNHQAIIEIVATLSKECRKRKIVMTGGETSIHNDQQGMDISITVSGFIEKYKPNKLEIGDILIGLKSNGLHSNGITKLREVYGTEVREDFVKPTEIYLDKLLELNEKFDIHGLMHITGGAFTKLKDIIQDANAIIHQGEITKPQKVFRDIYKKGASDEEMYKTFNCGVGFIISVPKSEAARLVRETEGSEIIGEVVKGSGLVKIQSFFSSSVVKY